MKFKSVNYPAINIDTEHNLNPAPLVSVLILCWKNFPYINKCLDCLTNQTLKDFEVVMIDNDSTDDLDNLLRGKKLAFKLTVEKLKKNEGFAIANNLGARLARGKWLALLNADAFPEPDWLEKLLLSAEENPEYAFFSSRQIQANSPDLLDGAGDAYHITGLAWRRHYNQLVQEYGYQAEEVFSACPTAALYSREKYLNAGGFDEDYFSYFEDVDLGFRLRLSGEKCLYVPEAVVQHIGSASTGKRSDFSVYYGYRNMIWTFVKNMPAPLIWIFLPLHVAAIFFFGIFLTLRGQGKAIWSAILDAVQGLPKMIDKRKAIQKNKRIKWIESIRVMSTGILEPFQELLHRNKWK